MRAEGAPPARVLADRTAPGGDAADRRSADGGAPHRQAADREQHAEGQAAEAREAHGEAADRDPARGDPADRDEPRRDVADRHDAPRVAAALAFLEIGTEGDRHQREVADARRAAVAYAPGAAATEDPNLLLQLPNAPLEIDLARHGFSS